MYEIGDKVIYQGADKNAYKKVGVLKSIEEKDGKPQLTVEFEGGETFTAPVDDWSKEFTNACKNAKFIKGDFVRVKGWPGTFRIDIVNPDGTYVLKKYPSGQPTIGSYKESELELEEANSRACRSTNSVVRNAIAANRRIARNGESEQREIVEMNIDSLKKDLDKVVRGLDETKRWMGKYGDNRIASIDKAKGAVVQAIQQLKY